MDDPAKVARNFCEGFRLEKEMEVILESELRKNQQIMKMNSGEYVAEERKTVESEKYVSSFRMYNSQKQKEETD